MKQKVKYKGILFIVLSGALLCIYEYVCTNGRRPAGGTEEFFPKSGGVYHCSGNNGAAQRSFSGGKRKLEVYDFAGRLRNNGDPV